MCILYNCIKYHSFVKIYNTCNIKLDMLHIRLLCSHGNND